MKEWHPRGVAARRRQSAAISSSPSQTSSTVAAQGELVALRYEETVAATPPIPLTTASTSPPAAPPTPALRSGPKAPQAEPDNKRRDSGLAPTTSLSLKATEDSASTSVEEDVLLGSSAIINFISPTTTPKASSSSTSNAVEKNTSPPPTGSSARKTNIAPPNKGRKGVNLKRRAASKALPSPKPMNVELFVPITTHIPTESLLDDGFLEGITFTRRGSVMLRGKKAAGAKARQNGSLRQPSASMVTPPSIKVLSEDVEKESQKVRSMYEQESALDWRDGGSYSVDPDLNIEEEDAAAAAAEGIPSSNGLLSPNGNGDTQRPSSCSSIRSEPREHERAGGIEDWEDVSGRDVDRYGFICTRKVSRPGTPEPTPLQRIPTVLQLATDAPRKKRFGGGSSLAPSSNTKEGVSRTPSRKVSARSLNTQASNRSTTSVGRAQLRAAANRLPGNRDRRWMDEAGDMLTLPPGLADIAEDEEGGKAAESLKKKEWERTEKWRKMAKVSKTGKDGRGMQFEFDTRSSKLIERTWKGIPDRWRAAAWHSFLSASAKKRKGSASDEDIIQAFENLQHRSSADDLQIDTDVPRTINSHIMFRRRYRGGQRLLFRVLHAVALYFPDTGYVQGMASLAATLLCYYDEEMAFVMLVRLWTLRGLDKLYETGFPGLMAALDEFQKQWLGGREVSRKLDELMIDPTAYGTRWYLTLFNYSIPFPAQLRVWDVFMLLGDPDPTVSATEERPFAGSLDILHATSTALIDGTREILLDSDFENAMKVLTSWIPVKDEELLMRVARAEWKLYRSKKKRRP